MENDGCSFSASVTLFYTDGVCQLNSNWNRFIFSCVCLNYLT